MLKHFLQIVDAYHRKPCNCCALLGRGHLLRCCAFLENASHCVYEVHFLDMQASVCISCSQSVLLLLRSFLAVSQTYHCLIRTYCIGTVGSHRKGRYIPLAALVRRVGANQMLSMQSDLLKQVHICLPCHAYAPAGITSLHLHAEFDLLCVNSVACRARLAV